ncbi:transposase [Nitrosomonas sp.]|uniref:transposase n=1 Tax=Nitrosomonas sp. TaxID=42353 RepID=UPI00352080D2
MRQKIGVPLSLSAIYRMLARHGWRKIAPDTAHPKGDLLVREDWEKLPGVLDQTITEFAMPRPVRPLVKAMLAYEYTYAYAAVCPLDGMFDSLVLPNVNTECMQIFLDEIARRYPNENIVMVMDRAGWHRSHSLTLAENLRLLLLPPYSPELNPIEHLWDELREKNFHNRVFDSIAHSNLIWSMHFNVWRKLRMW